MNSKTTLNTLNHISSSTIRLFSWPLLIPFLLINLIIQGCTVERTAPPTFSTQHEILVFNLNGKFLLRSPALRGEPKDMEFLPDGNVLVAVDGRGLTTVDPETGEISRFIGPSYISEVDYIKGQTVFGVQPTYLAVWYHDSAAKLLDDNGQVIYNISIPQGCMDIDLLENGNLLITESRNNRIREVTQEGETVWQSDVSMVNPFDTTLTPYGTYVISDFDHHRVIEIDRNNRIIFSQGGFNHPRRNAFLQGGRILVVDSDQKRVVEIKRDGGFREFITGLNRPSCIAVDEQRNLLVLGIEAFFPLTDDIEVITKTEARWKSWMIWWTTSLAFLLLFLVVHIYGEFLRATWLKLCKLSNVFIENTSPWLTTAGIVLACVAAGLWNFGHVKYGSLFMGAGCILILLTRWRLDQSDKQEDESYEYDETLDEDEDISSNRFMRFPFMILLGFILSWLVIIWSITWSEDWWPVIPWFIGPLLCVFGFQKRSRQLITSKEIAWILLILIVATVFRVHRIDEIPAGLWLDETYATWDAIVSYQNDSLPPFETMPLVRANEFEVTNLYLLIIAWATELFTPTFLFAKCLSIIPGIGIVLALYCLGYWSFGLWAGRIAGLTIAVNSWMVTFARWGWLQQLYVCFAIFALAFLLRAYRWRCPRSAALAGLFLGYGLYTYVPIILTIAVVAGVYIITLLVERDRREIFKLVMTTAFVCIIVFAPLWIYYLENPGIFLKRAQGVGLTNDIFKAGSLQPLKENLTLYAQAFHGQGDFIPRHNKPYQPLLEPITGGLMVLGLVLLLWRFYRPAAILVLLAFVFGMLGGILSARYESPNTFRIGMAGPMVCLFAALPLANVLNIQYQQRFKKWWTYIFVLVVMLAMGGANYYKYFIKFPGPDTWIGSMGQVQHLVYEHLEPEDIGKERLWVHPYFTTRTFNLYMYFLNVQKKGDDALLASPPYTRVDIKQYIPAPAKGKNTYVVPPDYESMLKEHIPNDQITKLENPYGNVEAIVGWIMNE